MRYLRTNTATRITVGPFLDKTDGITPEVALTATNEHLTLVVDTGGVPTLALDANATASGGNNDLVHVTNDDAGYYDLELTAANTNYLGRASLSVNYATDHCPVFHEFMILDAEAYDALFVAGRMARDLGIVCRGTVAAGGSTTAFTLGTVTSGALTDIQVGDIVKVAGLPGRIVKTINTGTGATTVTTALASDPSTLAFIVFGAAPADSTIPVPANIVDSDDIDLTVTQKASVQTAADAAIAAFAVETGLTLKNALRVIAAVALGETTGGATATPVFKSVDLAGGIVQSTTNRVTGASVDEDGNRGKPVLDLA